MSSATTQRKRTASLSQVEPQLSKTLYGIDVNRIEKILGNDQPDSFLLKTCRLSDDHKQHVYDRHLSAVKGKNERYLKHISGDCKCGKCKCTRCRCVVTTQLQLDSKKNVKSVYQQEYAKRAMPVRAIPFVLDKDVYRAQHDFEHTTGAMTTTHRKDFTGKPGVDPKVECGYLDRNNLICGVQSINGNTVYASSFKNSVIPKNVLFTHAEVEYLCVPHEKIALSKLTEQREKFKKEEDEARQKKIHQINFALDRQKNLKLPISMGVAVESQSTARQSYAAPESQRSSRSSSKVHRSSSSAAAVAAAGAAGAMSTSADVNREFIKTKNSWVTVFAGQKKTPNLEGQFLTEKESVNKQVIDATGYECPGWKEIGDVQVRVPKRFYQTVQIGAQL